MKAQFSYFCMKTTAYMHLSLIFMGPSINCVTLEQERRHGFFNGGYEYTPSPPPGGDAPALEGDGVPLSVTMV